MQVKIMNRTEFCSVGIASLTREELESMHEPTYMKDRAQVEETISRILAEIESKKKARPAVIIKHTNPVASIQQINPEPDQDVSIVENEAFA